MKRRFRTIAIVGLMFGMAAMTSCKNGNEQEKNDEVQTETAPEGDMNKAETTGVEEKADAEFSDETVKKAYDNYLKVKEAMVAADPEQAKTAASALENTFKDAEDQSKVVDAAKQIASSDDINKQRESFSELTAAMEPVLKNSITSGAIYKQFCPMAFEGKGDYWYSDTKTIRNPYFGHKMLDCGRTEETIQ